MTEFVIEVLTWLSIIWMVLTVLRVLAAHSEAKEAMTRFRDEADRRIRVVDLERIPEQNSILAYDKENNQFLGQGHTVEDVKQCIIQRFPTKIFILGDKVFSALPQVNMENRT